MNKKEDLLRLNIHESWHDILFPLFLSNDMEKIIRAYSSNKCYPEKENIFKVFSMPIDNIKCVLLGQDPYPDGSAIGKAFAVSKNSKVPLSLRVIEKSIQETYNTNVSIDYTLSDWENQGVFLLNTALTVQAGKPESHLELWKYFSIKVIEHISKIKNPIWILLGKKAQDYKKVIITDNNVNYKIIERSHPSATRYGVKFIPFCNEIIEIKWI